MTTSQPLQDPPVARKNDKSDKDLPLIQDIRLLGRILGDVIREQDGVAVFDVIEQVRQLSVAFRRDADAQADKALEILHANGEPEAYKLGVIAEGDGVELC